MRLRNKPWAKPLIQENPQYVVTDPATLRGNWQSRFEKRTTTIYRDRDGKGRLSLRWPRNILSVILSVLKCKQLLQGSP